MATAEQLRHEFTSYLDSNDIVYQTVDETNNIVHIGFGGDDSSIAYEIEIFVSFDESDDEAMSVHFAAPHIGKVRSSDLYAEALIRINEANRAYRWCCFYLQSKGIIGVDCDQIIFPGTTGIACTEIIMRIVSISQDVLTSLDNLLERDDITDEQREQLSIMLKELFG